MGRILKKLTTLLFAVILTLVQFSVVYGSSPADYGTNEENTRQAYANKFIELEKQKMGNAASLGDNSNFISASLSDADASGTIDKSKKGSIVPGKMIVKYKSNVSGSQKTAMNAKVSALSSVTDKRLGFTELKLPKDADVLKEVEKLKSESGVEYAEPVYVRKAASVVESVYCSDEFYSNGLQWGLQAIAPDDMWGSINEDQLSDVVIAVIDSGVDLDHNEFEGRIVQGYDFINNDSDPDDDYGHGTHVAGIAAAVHNGSGIAGVAGGAWIMPVKALDEYGSGDTVSIVNSILYAVNNGADVINMSLGGEEYSYAEAEAVKYAVDRGVTVVAAAGNTYGGSILYPAAYDGAISVGAADWNENSGSFEFADFSAEGTTLDLVAPGVDILSSIPEELDTLNNYAVTGLGDTEKDGYTLGSGTSMAAPFVAGMAALILANNRELDCGQVLAEMKVNAGNIGDYQKIVINGDNEGDINPPFSYRQLSLDMSYGDTEGERIFTLTGGGYRNTVSEAVYGDFNLMMGRYEYNDGTITWVTEPYIVETLNSPEDTTASIVLPDEGNYLFYVPGANGLMGSNIIDVFTDMNDSFSDAVSVQIGIEAASSLDSAGDVDYFKFTVLSGEEGIYTIETTGSLDTFGYLYNENNLTGYTSLNDDDGTGGNFLMEESLASGTYYVEISGYYGYELGDYGLKVSKGPATPAPAISGTVSLPQGVAAGDLLLTVNVFQKSWDSPEEKNEYWRVGNQEITIAGNTSSANYSIPIDTLPSDNTGYIVEYRLDSTETDYAQAGYYGTTATGISESSASEVVVGTANADLTLISKDSISDEESNTPEASEDFGLSPQPDGSIDYAGDFDCYRLTVEADGNYIIGSKHGIISNKSFYFNIDLYDENGNFMLTTRGRYKYNDGDYGSNITAGLTADKNYYLVVNSIDDSEWLPLDYTWDLFSPFAYSLNISPASLISGTISIPDDVATPNVETAVNDNIFMIYVDFPANNSNGISEAGSHTLISEGETSSSEYKIYVPSAVGYLLSYYLLSNPNEERYADSGYYDGDTEITVYGAENATPVDMTNDKEVNFTLLPIDAIPDPEGSSKETAASIQIWDIVNGYLNYPTDEDYFKFHADQAGYYTIQDLSDVNALNAGTYLYDGSDWIEYAETGDGIITRYLSEGDYYLKLRGNNSYGNYEFLVELETPPVADNVHISGTTKVGSALTGSYTYSDANGDEESRTSFRWLRSSTQDGVYSAISGATARTYTLTANDVNKYIKFEVAPKAANEPKEGSTVLSTAVGPIAVAADNGGGSSGSGGAGGSGSEDTGGTTEDIPAGKATITKTEDNKVNITIDVGSSNLDSMLTAAGTSPVTIDVRTSADADELKVNIPLDIFAGAEESQKPLVIESNDVSFTIEPGTLDITDTNAVVSLEVSQLSLDAVPEAARNMDAAADEVSMVFDFGMFVGDDKVTEFGKPVTITVKFDATKVTDSGKVGVYYYNEKDGRWEYVGGRVNEDGTITFTVEHFSKYAVMEYKKTFADITNHWAKSDIELMAARHVTSGISDSMFAPENNITRAEFAAMLSRALGLKTDSDALFEDIPANAWYKEDVSKAFAAGIISGVGNREFAPGENITREQMAAMLMNAYSYATGKSLDGIVTTMQVRFRDEASAGNWARRYITLANATGLMNGSPDGAFRPKGNATRAEAVVTVKRLLEKLDRL